MSLAGGVVLAVGESGADHRITVGTIDALHSWQCGEIRRDVSQALKNFPRGKPDQWALAPDRYPYCTAFVEGLLHANFCAVVEHNAVSGVDSSARTVGVSLNRAMMEGSPGIDTDKPVSRQHEADFAIYYGYPAYWPNPAPWAGGAPPIMQPVTSPGPDQLEVLIPTALPGKEPVGDSHLRSAAEVTGYGIEATDADIGHVEDFIFDDTTWLIQHMVINTRKWLPGKHILISPGWISGVNWLLRVVKVDRTRAEIRHRLEFDPEQLPDTAALQAPQVGAAGSVSKRSE